MESLDWVDRTYIAKHKSDDPTQLRAMYYPNLVQYPNHGPGAQKGQKKKPMDAVLAFLLRFGRRAGISLAVYLLSFLPVVGRFVLPAASFYTFKNAVGTQPAIVIFATGVVVPKRYLVMFLQSYFSSRSLMRELVRRFFSLPLCRWMSYSPVVFAITAGNKNEEFIHPEYLIFPMRRINEYSSSNHISPASTTPKSKSASGSKTAKASSSASASASLSFSRSR